MGLLADKIKLKEQDILQTLMTGRPRVSAAAWVIVRDTHAAEDIFQNVALKAMTCAVDFETANALLSWAFITARHEGIDWLRRRKREATCLDTEVLELLEREWQCEPLHPAGAKIEALQKCLKVTSASSRRLLKLRSYQGLRCEAVARQRGIGLALITSGGFDQCMLSYGYIPRGYDQIGIARMTTRRDACTAKAHELGMGSVAMTVIGAGMLGAWCGHLVPGFDKQRLRSLPAAAIRHVLQDRRVHVLNIGMRLKEEIDANIKTLCGDSSCTLEDRALLAEFSARLYDTDAIKELRTE